MSEIFPAGVYVLCLLTSGACGWLLGRTYQRTRLRLLLWSSICFGFLALNNLLLVLDLLIWPQTDLRIARVAASLAAILSLIWGFIWDDAEGFE
jgi:hypothetical protein